MSFHSNKFVLFAFLSAIGATACSSDDSSVVGVTDAGSDGTTDGSTDAGHVTVADSSVDGSPEAAPGDAASHDGAPDGSADGSPDASPEAGPDAEVDGSSDAADASDATTPDAGDADAGAVVSYTFATSTQGWELSNFADTTLDNLGAPDSGATPTLALNTTDGEPTPGSLEVTVPFTGPNQYVDVIVNIASPLLDLAGDTLHANVRLVCGTFPLGGVKLHASTGASYSAYIGGTFVDSSAFTVGTWVPVSLDLTSMPPVDGGYDPTMVIQIGVQILTSPAAPVPDAGDAGDAGDAEAIDAGDAGDAEAIDAGDAAAIDAGDAGPCSGGAPVFEIDTVTN